MATKKTSKGGGKSGSKTGAKGASKKGAANKGAGKKSAGKAAVKSGGRKSAGKHVRTCPRRYLLAILACWGSSSLAVTLVAFAHIHELSIAEQTTEKRGVFVARVTADIDTLSHFTEWGGMAWLLSLALMIGSLALMLAYSWRLTIPVLVLTILLSPLGFLGYLLLRIPFRREAGQPGRDAQAAVAR